MLAPQKYFVLPWPKNEMLKAQVFDHLLSVVLYILSW